MRMTSKYIKNKGAARIGKMILNLFQKDMKKHILIGWKIYKTGVFHANYGGDTEFRHIIVINVNICMFQKQSHQNVRNVDIKK